MYMHRRACARTQTTTSAYMDTYLNTVMFARAHLTLHVHVYACKYAHIRAYPYIRT